MKVMRVVTFGTLWYNMGKMVAHIYLHICTYTLDTVKVINLSNFNFE